MSSVFDPTITTSVDANSPPSLAEVVGTTESLVGKGSVGNGPDTDYVLENEVHVQPTLIDEGKASIAWWISGENTKALLEEKTDPTDVAGWRELLATTSGPDASAFQITDTDDLGRVGSRGGLDYLPNAVTGANTLSREYFHDLTTHSKGLLTNTANGGWRRDLSLLSEQWPDLLPADLPFFSISPGVETLAAKASGDTHALLDLTFYGLIPAMGNRP